MNESYPTPHLSYVTVARKCAVCEATFIPRKENQRYCGITCRKKNERMQARAHDPKRALTPQAVVWTQELINPTEAMLRDAADLLRYRTTVAKGAFVPPVKIVGAIPESWTCPPDVVITRPPDGSPFRTMVIDEFAGMSMNELIAGAVSVGAQTVPRYAPRSDTPPGWDAAEWAMLSEEDRALVLKPTPDPAKMKGAEIPPERPKSDPLEQL